MERIDLVTTIVNYKRGIVGAKEVGAAIDAYAKALLDKANVVGSGNELPDEDDEDYHEPEQQCSACCMVGGHMRGCPEDESPYAQLLRDGYD